VKPETYIGHNLVLTDSGLLLNVRCYIYSYYSITSFWLSAVSKIYGNFNCISEREICGHREIGPASMRLGAEHPFHKAIKQTHGLLTEEIFNLIPSVDLSSEHDTDTFNMYSYMLLGSGESPEKLFQGGGANISMHQYYEWRANVIKNRNTIVTKARAKMITPELVDLDRVIYNHKHGKPILNRA